MGRLLIIFSLVFMFQACGTEHSSSKSNDSNQNTSGNCFNGWISERGNTDPTGFCKESVGSIENSTRLEVDYPSQRLYIHGSVRNHENGTTKWLSRSFRVESCQDVNGWTNVEGVNSSNNERYLLTHREIREVPPTGQAKQAFEGEAKLSFELDGESHQIDLSCVRNIF